MRTSRSTVSFLAVLAFASSLTAVPAPASKPARATAAPVASVEGITEYVLANGLRVLLFPDPAKPTITVNITYLVGSRNEAYGETGMAHLLEHLAFKGTPRHPNIPQELTAHGARPNGTTWFDRTNYYETFQATAENLEWALDLEADRMVNSFISKKDLDSEMTVVRNEFEMGENDPASILQERVLSTAYLWHNYGNSTIGARADIENVPIEKLRAFYKTYYQPDNAVLLVAGRFDERETLQRIVRLFSPIPRPTRRLPTTYTSEPVQDGERIVTLRRVGDVGQLAVAYHVPSGSHADAPAVDVLTEVLSDTPSGRLHKALVETKKAASVGGYFQALRDPGFLMLTAEVRQDQPVEDARATLLATVDGLSARPPTSEEIERARAALLKRIDLTLNSVDRVGLELSEWIGMGDWRLFFLHRDRLRKVGPQEVGRAAAAYLKSTNRTIGTFVPTPKPDRAEIPPAPDLAALLQGYKGDPAAARGEAFDPSPANIEARTTRSRLESGLELALLPKKTRGETVVLSMTLRFGDLEAVRGRATAADLAGDMLLRGTRRHDRQQLQDLFDRLKARVSISGGPTQVGVSVETTRPNLAQVLKLVAEVLREPSFPATEFEQLRQENLAAIEEQRSDPGAIAQTAFGRHMNPYPKGDVRYVETPEEALEAYTTATLEEAKSFHSGFYGASNGNAAIVGDFDAAEISRLMAELFGDWKSPRAFERVARPYQAVPPRNEALPAPDKANAFFVAGVNLEIRDDDPDYPALLLGNYLLGGGFLNSRLATRIRQKEGLSYGIGSQFSASPLDRSGTFVAFAIYAPQNAARLEQAFQEEVARVLKDGFTRREVAEAGTGYLQSRQVTRAQDASLARTLETYLYLDRTFAWDEAIDKQIAALTPERILEAMRRRLDPSKLTIVKAGDFEKAAGPEAPIK